MPEIGMADWLIAALAEADTPAEEPWPRLEPLPAAAPAAPSLPDELLPEPLRPWLADVADRASIPLEYVGVPAMVGLGAVVGRALGIRPERYDDFLTVPNLWGALVGPPGSMKSHAVSESLRPVTRLEAEARRAAEEAAAQSQAAVDRIEAEITAIKQQMVRAAKTGNPTTELEAELAEKLREKAEVTVNPRRYMTNDPTIEKLGELLRQNPRGLLLVRDELAGWLRTMDRPGREGDREFWLETWNGTGSYTFDRVGRGTIHIESVCVSVVGGIQPAKLIRYVNESIADGGSDGLLQRLQLLVWPDSLGEWRPITRWPDAEARARAYEVYRRLSELRPSDAGATIDGEDVIPFLRFAPDAQELWTAWRGELERRVRSGELDRHPVFQSHIAKYRSLMPSLALLLHLVDVVDGRASGAVSLAAAQRAAAWCEFLEAHVRKVYAAELDDGAGAAAALAERIQQGRVRDGDSVRDIYRHHWRGLDTQDQVDRALAVLARHGWVRVQVVQTGGRPTEVVRLHPDLRRENA